MGNVGLSLLLGPVNVTKGCSQDSGFLGSLMSMDKVMRWMTAFRSFCLLALLGQAIRTLPARATTYLSNTGTPFEGTGVGTNWIAQSFETGTNSGGYILNSITTSMMGIDGSPTGFALSVFSRKGVFPSSSLEVLTGSSDPSVYGAQYTYTSTGLLLQPSTIYWLVASATTPYYFWPATHAQDYTSPDGWFLDTTNFSRAMFDPVKHTWSLNSATTYGTLDFILDATAIHPEFSVTAISREGNDMRISWQTTGGLTNMVQATSGGPGGTYNTNFGDLPPQFIINGIGPATTNYLDVGGATNFPARYYRVRLVP